MKYSKKIIPQHFLIISICSQLNRPKLGNIRFFAAILLLKVFFVYVFQKFSSWITCYNNFLLNKLIQPSPGNVPNSFKHILGVNYKSSKRSASKISLQSCHENFKGIDFELSYIQTFEIKYNKPILDMSWYH